jgi:hypothetical protein
VNVKIEKKIALDCKTRCNSTYIMLSTALPYKVVFMRASRVDRQCNTPGVRLAFWTLALHRPKHHLFIYEHRTYETCVYGMCLQHLLETYATYFC